MRASTQYNDLKGNVTIDRAGVMSLEDLAVYCNLDTERYTIIGIKLSGVNDIDINLICRDNIDSTPNREILVDVTPAVDITLDQVIERMKITFNLSGDAKYDNPDLDTDREVTLEEMEDEDSDD